MDPTREQELKDLVEKLKGFDAADVLNVLPRGAGTVFQAAYDVGHRAGKHSEATKRETAEQELETAQTQVADLRTKLREVESRAPDGEKMQKQYDEQLGDERKKFEHKEQKLLARIDRAEYGNAISTLESKLIASGMRPIFAAVRAKEARDRIKFDKDGSMSIVQSGRDAIPIQVKDGQDPIVALSEEIFSVAEPDEKAVNVPAGPGVRTSTQSAPSPQTSNAYDAARQAVAAKREEKQHRGSWQQAIGR